MKRRIFFYLFLLFDTPLHATVINNKPYTIPTVIVTAKQNVSLTSGPKTSITQQQLRDSGVRTLSQALQHMGVQLQDLTGNGSQVLLSMRGFGANASSNTLFIVNGIPLTNPDMAPPDLNTIPIDEIELVEVIAGSESVLYGDQAVGGTVNVVTRNRIREKSTFSCHAGSYHQYGCYATLQERYQSINSNLTLLKEHSDNYRDHNDYDQKRLLGRFDFIYSVGKLIFDYNLVDEKMLYPGALTATEVRENRRQASNDTDFFKDWNGFFHFNHQHLLIEHWKIETDTALRRMNGDGVLFSPFTQSRSIFFLKPQLNGIIGKNIITSGFDFQSDDYHLNSAFGITDEKQQKYNIFTLATIPLHPSLTLSAGARGAELRDHLKSATVSHHINRALATTLGMTYEASSDIHLYLRRAESFRFPKADENAFAPLGVTSLRTQRGVSYETGVEFNTENNSGKLGLYQLNLKDEIAFDPTQTPQQPFGSNRNLAPTIRRGFTLSGKKQITHQFSIDGQYNYVNARFQNGPNVNNRIPLVSENIIRAGLHYQMTPQLSLYTDVIYTGNQFPANDDANINGSIGGYTVYNFNLRYDYQQFSAALRLNNIFNKYYYFYTVLQQTTEFFYPAPGRNFTLTFNYEII